MANYADVKVHIQAGTGQGGSSPPPTSNGWVRAKSQDGNGNWTVDSEYWFYYSGGNGNGSGNGGTAGGEVDIPAADGGTFTVGPSGNEVINSISFIETQTPPPATPNYTTSGPVGGIFTVSDRAHEDPAGDSDAFDVFACANNSPGATLLKCDPIIRNIR